MSSRATVLESRVGAAVPYLSPKDFVESPEAMDRAWTPEEAAAYTSWLATHHYENFHVVSVLLPKRLHRDFYAVYSFCRWADDLGDEMGDPRRSLELLAWWRRELDAMYCGRATHPVYVALAPVAERHHLPQQLFADLIQAFVQDQTVTRYETWEEVLGYCRCSANPVGRLVLRLCGYADSERDRLSDATCTALQLANFWQDVAVDLEKGRIYLPLEVLRRNGYSEAELLALRFTPGFRDAMREAVGFARKLFIEGLPLVGRVDRRLAFDIDLFSRGGMLVLEKIEQLDCNVLARRPAIGKVERAGLLLRTLGRIAFSRAA